MVLDAPKKLFAHKVPFLKEIGFDRNKQPEGMTVEQYGKAMEYVNKY